MRRCVREVPRLPQPVCTGSGQSTLKVALVEHMLLPCLRSTIGNFQETLHTGVQDAEFFAAGPSESGLLTEGHSSRHIDYEQFWRSQLQSIPTVQASTGDILHIYTSCTRRVRGWCASLTQTLTVRTDHHQEYGFCAQPICGHLKAWPEMTEDLLGQRMHGRCLIWFLGKFIPRRMERNGKGGGLGGHTQECCSGGECRAAPAITQPLPGREDVHDGLWSACCHGEPPWQCTCWIMSLSTDECLSTYDWIAHGWFITSRLISGVGTHFLTASVSVGVKSRGHKVQSNFRRLAFSISFETPCAASG
jgi:hypothetical protein